MQHPAIDDRRALGAYLQEQMVAGKYPHAPLASDKQVFGRNSVKAFLIEAHMPRDTDELLKGLSARLIPRGMRVSASQDADLISIADAKSRMWIDVSRGRFWRGFCVDDNDDAKTLHKNLLHQVRALDGTWLHAGFLAELPGLLNARAESFRLGVDRRGLMPPEEGSDGHTNRLTMKVWHPLFQEHLKFLRSGPLYSGATSLMNMRLRLGADDDVVVSEFFGNGRVTATGTSFAVLNSALLAVIDSYQALVRGIEEQFGIGRTGDGFKGRTLEVELDWRVEDRGFAVDRILSATQPFRLCGIPREVTAGRWQAWVADLHMAQPLVLDFSKRSLVIHLPSGTCGNTVVRLIANLQRTLSSNIEMVA